MRNHPALTAALLLAGAFSSFGDPEPIMSSGKEMKAVVEPVAQPECNWTGFYIGAHVGYGWNDF